MKLHCLRRALPLAVVLLTALHALLSSADVYAQPGARPVQVFVPPGFAGANELSQQLHQRRIPHTLEERRNITRPEAITNNGVLTLGNNESLASFVARVDGLYASPRELRGPPPEQPAAGGAGAAPPQQGLGNNPLDAPFGDTRTLTINALTAAIFRLGIVLLIIAAAIFIAIGAYAYFAAAGNAEFAKRGLDYVQRSIIGLVLGLLAFVILQTISPQFTQIREPTLQQPGGN